MRILAISIRHVVLELTLVYVTFSMPECALTFRFVEVPLAFVVRSISPVLNAIAMSEFLNMSNNLPWAEEYEAAVLFADISGFSRLAESLKRELRL